MKSERLKKMTKKEFDVCGFFTALVFIFTFFMLLRVVVNFEIVVLFLLSAIIALIIVTE